VREKEQAAKEAKEERQKSLRDAQKAIQLSQKSKRKAIQASKPLKKRQKRAVVGTPRVEASGAAIVAPTQKTKTRLIRTPKKYSE
jgi:hypothetical protein